MKKNIVIIGANEFQEPLIQRARELGYVSHVFAWQADDVGEYSADYFYPISIIEKERILEICRKIEPVGIVSIASDLAAITVNYVAEALGLVGNGMESAMVSTNKHLMRRAFEKAGLPSCKSVLADEGMDLSSINMDYPLIVKPTDRSGSRGIFKVLHPEELESAVAFAREPSFEKRVLIEEFAEGREYSIEYISYEGQHTFLACTEKFTTGAPMFVETGHLQPPKHMDAETLGRIKALVPKVLDSLGVKHGASHTELKIDVKGNIKLIECGARMGGDCIGSDLVKLSTGIDFVGAVIDVACGRAPALRKSAEPKISAIRFIFNQQELECFEKIKALRPESIYRASEIMPIDGRQISDSSTRYGFYILQSESMEDMLGLLKMSGIDEAYFE